VETLSKEERLRILRTIEIDPEFRHALLAALGYGEILERLSKNEEYIKSILQEIRSLREEQIRMREEITKIWGEIKSLREEQIKMREEMNRIWEEISKIWGEIKSLREEQIKFREEQVKMREEMSIMSEAIATLSRKVDVISRTVERLALSLEEEAIDVVRSRLRDDLGVIIDLDRVFIDDKEINIYGVSGDLCVVGEATIRLGRSLVEELERIVEFIKSKRPDMLRPKLIKVIYAYYATDDAKKLASEKGIWVVRSRGDLTSRVIHETR